jgi:hypothetical protein
VARASRVARIGAMLLMRLGTQPLSWPLEEVRRPARAAKCRPGQRGAVELRDDLGRVIADRDHRPVRMPVADLGNGARSSWLRDDPIGPVTITCSAGGATKSVTKYVTVQ